MHVGAQEHGQASALALVAELVVQQAQQDAHHRRLVREPLRVSFDGVVGHVDVQPSTTTTTTHGGDDHQQSRGGLNDDEQIDDNGHQKATTTTTRFDWDDGRRRRSEFKRI